MSMERTQFDELEKRYTDINTRVNAIEGKKESPKKGAKADSKKPVAAKLVPMHCMDDPGIPTPTKIDEMHWCPYWVMAALLIPVVVYGFFCSLYSSIYITLPAGSLIDVKATIAGCDLIVDTCKGGDYVRLGWWHFLNDGGTGMSFVNDTLTVDKQILARSDMFRCTLRMCLSSKKNHEGYHANSLHFNIEADKASLQNAGPSNLAETVAGLIRGVDAKEYVIINSTTTASLLVQGVDSPKMSIDLAGGKLQVAEHVEHATSASNLAVNAVDSTVSFALHRKDLVVKLKDAITTEMATLSGASVASIAGADGSKTVYLSREGGVSAFPTDKAALEKAAYVTLYTRHGASYFLVADDEHMTNKDLKLDTIRGSGVEKPRLLRDGIQAFKTLRDWLVAHGTEKYVVYMHLLHAHAPSGTLRLLSTAAYKAFSLWEFALATGGMLSPQIIRIETPFVGMDNLFPRRACDPPLTEEEVLTYSKTIFFLVDGQINISSLALPSAKYLWDPSEGADYMFDLIPARRGTPEHWIERPLDSSDTIMFSIAAYITIFLGLGVGAVVVWAVQNFVVPNLFRKMRADAIVNSASYRRDYIIAPTTWAMNSAYITYPRTGVLLRWDKRPMADRFAMLSFTAKAWPKSATIPNVKLDKVLPDRIPVNPAVLKQQYFCFATKGELASGESGNEFFNDPFDQGIAGTWSLRMNTAQKMQTGKLYMFQCTAWDADGKVVERSAWSRPTMLNGATPFTTYPLLMWKSYCGILPTDTFELFLNKFCLPIEKAPSMTITLKNLKLAIAQIPFGFFGGQLPGKYGMDNNPMLAQTVQLMISTGDDEQVSNDTLFVDTSEVPLPTAMDDCRKKGNTKPAKVVFPPSGHFNESLNKAEFFMVEFNQKEALVCPVGSDLTQVVRIEAAIQIGPSLNTDNTAKFLSNWSDFSVTLTSLLTQKKQGVPTVTQNIVLNDGLTPVACLQADVEFGNAFFANPAIATYPKEGIPAVFDNIAPGRTFQWGQVVMLSWKAPADADTKIPDLVDLIIKSSKVDEPKDPNASPYKHVPKSLMKGIGEKQVTIKTGVSLRSGKVQFAMAPNQPNFLQKMKAQLLLVDPNDGNTVLATSSEICVTHPVTLQNLEVAYSSFCIRSNIPQNKVNFNTLETHGVDLQERDFYISTGYRPVLPIPREAKHLERAPNHKLIVKDPGSIYITNGTKREVDIFNSEEIEEADQMDATTAAPVATGKGLKEPLLAGASSSSDGPANDKTPDYKVEFLTPQRQTLDIPTNVFWKYDAEWKPDVLLWYSLLPNIAVDGYVTKTLELYEYYRLATLLGKFDDIFRITFRLLLWVIQSSVLSIPALLVLLMTMYRDSAVGAVNPGTHFFQEIKTIHMTDFVIHPSPFRLAYLEGFDFGVLALVGIYYIGVLVTCFLNNFLRNKLYESNSPSIKIVLWLDRATALVFSGLCFAFLVYVSVVATWILLGALIDPSKLMPYALCLGGILMVCKSQYGTLQMMKAHAEAKMTDFLNGAMHAMVSVFVGDTSAGPWLDMGQEHAFATTIAELIYSAEKEHTKTLYSQCDIKTDVGQMAIGRMKLVRQSPAFIQCLPGAPKNEIMITDFVPEAIIPIAQEIANTEATIDGTRNTPTPTGAIMPNDLTDSAVSKALSQYAEQSVPPPGQITADQQTELNGIAEHLKMRPETATMLSQAFSLATHLRKSPEEATLLQPASCAAMMSSIRMDQLFAHFILKPDGAAEKAPAKPASAPSTESPTTSPTKGTGDKKDPPPKPTGTSNAMKMLAEIQNKEMESFNGFLASSLTNLVNWTGVSRACQKFLDTTLNVQIGSVIDAQLNEHLNGSAMFELMMKVYDTAFSPKFETVYKQDPMKFYVDVGIVSAKQAAAPKCMAVLNPATDANKLFDGSTSPDTLINTVVALFVPSARNAQSDAAEVPNPLRLWYGAYKQILINLGFNKDEMDEAWLSKVWDDKTEGSGLFSYRLAETITTLVHATAADGLWQAAAKLLMYQQNIMGYASCNVARFKASPMAAATKENWDKVHAQAHAMFDRAPLPGLSWLNSDCPWPQYIEDLWKSYCGQEKIKVVRPDFLGTMGMLDFLQDCMYVPKEAVTQMPAKDEFDKLYAYPAKPLDLVWLVRKTDGTLWHDLPDGKRRMRGLWHEAVMAMWGFLDCVPTDLDIFYSCLQYQSGKQLKAQQYDQNEGTFLRHSVLCDWLKQEYLPKQTSTATFGQFKQIIIDMLKIEIPEAVLHTKVFTPCPLVPDDDLGELRKMNDLAAGLRMFMGMGIWQGGVGQIIEAIMPRGPLRTMAMTSLPSEFVNHDSQGNGILQPAEAVLLVHSLAHPGLTCDDLAITVEKDLGMEVNKREFHHYFTMVDVNCNNVLALDEFIPFMQMMMLDYFPGKVMHQLNLSGSKIAMALLGIVVLIGTVFICVTLIMSTFAAGSDVGAALHSGVTAITVAGSKAQSEADAGLNDAVSKVKLAIEGMILTTLTGVLGFAPQTIDVFKTCIANLQAGLKL